MRFFFTCRSLLTELDIKYLKVLVDEEIRTILRVRALFGLEILFPVMRLAKEESDGNSFVIKLANVIEVVKFTEKNPHQMETRKEHFLEASEKEMKDIKSIEASKEVKEEQKQIELVKELLQVDFVGPDEEERDIEDHILLSPSSFTASPAIIQKPSNYSIARPANLEELKNSLVVDACRSFLFQVNKHTQHSEINQVSFFFLPTSRSAERMFSQTKELLDRNKEMRIEVMNSILAYMICLTHISQKYGKPTMIIISIMRQPKLSRIVQKLAKLMITAFKN